MKIMQVVSAIIRHEDKVLMVQQPDEDGLYWFIPGGMVEPGELILEALRREVKEETGLTIDGDIRLAFVTQVESVYEARQIVAFNFEVATFSGDILPDDPDQLTHDAAFIATDDAIQRLERVVWASMRDPLRAYLRGELPAGSVWQFRQHSFREFELVHKIG